MKKAFLALGLLVLGIGLFGLGWVSHGGAGKAPPTVSPSSNAQTAGSASVIPAANSQAPAAAQPHQAPFVSQDEFRQLQSARDAALQANPDLAAEYKQIISDMQAQQVKFDAALIKADPKVAPVVAKLVALRQINGAHPPSAVSSAK